MTSAVKIVLLLLFPLTLLMAQKKINNEFGTIFRFNLENTSFPHKERESGHLYQGKKYSAEEHYNDKSALVFIPNNFIPKDSIDLVFYFHGWWNNIDTSISRFNLIEQFYQSNKKAILVLAEGAKNAPDSFGGKLEEKNTFKYLVDEILSKLNFIYSSTFTPGKIILAGHSGAYRVISFILMQGGITELIEAVFLFDGLYAETEKYINWITKYNGKFINIFTPNGGTKSESEKLMSYFDLEKLPYAYLEHDDFAADELKNAKLISIKSQLGHNEVIHAKDQFKKFLESIN
jgi:hypothetical protein